MPLTMLLTLDAPPLPDTADPIGDDKPTDVLRRAVRSLLETADPETAADALFDVPVVARRCLGRHWPERCQSGRCWQASSQMHLGYRRPCGSSLPSHSPQVWSSRCECRKRCRAGRMRAG